MNILRLLALVLLALPLAASAAPELNVGALYDYLDGGKSTLLKRVRNGGDTTASSRSASPNWCMTALAWPTRWTPMACHWSSAAWSPARRG